jgi:hypothetical protein
MTGSAVATDFNKTLNIESDCTAAVTFNLKVLIDVITQFGNIVLCKIFAAGVGVDTCCCEDLFRCGKTDTEDICESNFDSLIVGKVYTGYTCHLSMHLSFQIVQD